MTIQITIIGEHITDIFAQIQHFAQAITPETQIIVNSPLPLVPCAEPSVNEIPAAQPDVTEPASNARNKKIMNRKQQDAAVEEMVRNGARDERYEYLSKNRKDIVDLKLENPSEETADMFDEESPPVVTRQMVSDLMAKVGKDKDGNPVRERLLEIRAVLVENIPENPSVDPSELIRVKNIPEEKLADVYALIGKIGK